MIRRIRRWSVRLAMGAVMLCLLLTAGAAPVIALSPQNDFPVTLVALRAAAHPEAARRYDRVVFEFAGRLPENMRVEYVSGLIADGSGLPVSVRGKAILQLVFSPAYAHTDAGQPTVPARISYNLPCVTEVVRSGDFEAVVSYGIGLSQKTEFRFLTLSNPTRVVIDFFY